MDDDVWTKIVKDMKAAIGPLTPLIARDTVTPAGPPLIKKSSYLMHVPRELLLDAGAVEPTPAERAEYERQAAEHAAKLDAVRQQLASLTDPLTRVVLDLHSEDERGECEGCDFDGYEGERPSWPCRTVEAVAEHHRIALP